MFQGPEFPVGDVEEVAAPARRVQYDERCQCLEEFEGLLRGGGVIDAVLPRPDNARFDDLEDVSLVGVVRAEFPAALSSDHALKEGPEDRGVDLAPVVFGGVGEQVQFVPVEVHLGGVGE